MSQGWVLLVLAAVVLLPASPAMAHATLVETSPIDGSHLQAGPTEVTVTFDEAVEVPAGAVRVFDTARNRVDLGDSGPGSAPEEIRATLPAGLAPGAYVATWHAVSLDGHPIRGAFVFHVGHGSGAVDESLIADLLGEGGEVPFAAAGVMARWMTYLAGLAAAGAAVFLWATHAGDERTVGFTRWAAVVGVVGSLVQIPLFAAESTGLGVGAWSLMPALGDAIGSPVGRAALVRTAALVVVASATRLPRPAGWVWFGAGGVVAAELLSGHTLTTAPWLVVGGADLVHVTAAAVWLGGLACLVLLVRSARRLDDSVAAARVVGHFSRLATWSVAALALAGLVLAWAEVRTVGALTSTPYGWTLLAKTAVAALVLGAGAYNNRILVPAIAREAVPKGDNPGRGGLATATVAPSPAWAKLGRTLRLEAWGLVTVLALTAVLVNLQPAAEASGASGPFSAYLDFGDGQVNIVVDPNRVGANQIHAYVLTASGAPAELAGEATLELRLPVEDIGPIVRQPIPGGPGHWVYTGSDLAIAGRWEVTFRVSSGFEEQTATATIEVNG